MTACLLVGAFGAVLIMGIAALIGAITDMLDREDESHKYL